MKTLVDYLLESSSEIINELKKLADTDMGVNTNGAKGYGNLSGVAKYLKRQLISLYCDKLVKDDLHAFDAVVDGKTVKVNPQWAEHLSNPVLLAIYLDGASDDVLEDVSNIVLTHEVCDKAVDDLRVVVISEKDKVENLLPKEVIEKLEILNLS